jgi:glycerol-1-phosphate dehydrogenase [NAD(P)+]
MNVIATSGLCSHLPDYMGEYREALIVADPDTHRALGDTIIAALLQELKASLFLLPHTPKASLKLADSIERQLAGHSSAIAIGGGTINDLVKYAAHHTTLPYAVIATAPSMNGYSSATASLLDKGQKKSFSATPPRLILADLEVLRAAPVRMISAGVGDVLCRSTVEADWRLAHVKGRATYDDAIMQPLRETEAKLIAVLPQLAKRDASAMHALWNALIAGGDAMRRCGSSMPASQGEHMIAHAMHSETLLNPPLHGEEIAVTTLSMARLQERMLTLAQLSEHTAWIGEHRHSAQQLEHWLMQAGCATTPDAIGWDTETYRRTANSAWRTRDRYGFLALAAEYNIEVE